MNHWKKTISIATASAFIFLGIVGAGNVGTAFAALLAPMLAQKFGWQTVYGFAAISVVIPAYNAGAFIEAALDNEPECEMHSVKAQLPSILQNAA